MPLRPDKTPLGKLAAVAVFVAICLVAYQWQPSTGPRWYSIVPPLLAVTLALLTNRIFLSLGAAVVAGGLLGATLGSAASAPAGGSPEGPYKNDFQCAEGDSPIFLAGKSGQSPSDSGTSSKLFHATGGAFVFNSISDGDNQLILLYVVLIMAAISVMLLAGGLQGVAVWLMKFARSVRSAKLVTMAAGLVIFIDDYANTMIVGSTLRPMTDRQRISREKLAFLVDATAAPIAGIAIISTWIGVEVGYLSDFAVDYGVGRDGYAIFFDALGFRFYCIGMIAFVFFNALSGEDFGPMGRAERRSQEHGKLLEDDASPMTSRSLAAARPHPQVSVHATVAVVPMVVLLAAFVGRLWFDAGGAARPAADLLRFSVWREVLAEINSIPRLAYASGLGLVVAMALALVVARIPVGALAKAVWLGAKSSLMPVTVLVLAWSLKRACDDLQTGAFLAETLADSLSPAVFPPLVFLVAAVTSFATGTSWGTMAILIPTAIPVAFQLDGNVYGPATIISVAAVLDGSIFGDHCSPISDTTIMSSTASCCDHLAHVRTQMPYSLVVAALALCVGYLPAAAGVSKWVGIAGGCGLAGLLFLGLRLLRR